MNSGSIRTGLALCSLALLRCAAAEPAAILAIDAAHPGAAVSPVMYGIFFEDINYAGDGGLYAELVENRSFEHREGLYAWRKEQRGAAAGTAEFAGDDPIHPNNPRFVRIDVARAGAGLGVSNLGYEGLPLDAGAAYRCSLFARSKPGYAGGLRILLESPDGSALAADRVTGIGRGWTKFTVVLKPSAREDKARLAVLADAAGQVDVDMISLFPVNTWKQRENGLRADLVQVLADMRPGFMRFPGGCIVEGKDLANAYRWKDTVGPVEARKQNWNRWQEVMANPRATQYSQTYGLGFFEFFQLCEDIGAAPVPVLNCGMSCQYQLGQLVPLDQLGPWVQDALDLIEFANGPAGSVWGGLRARMGHPAPFGLKHLAIGNEQWQQPFFDRYVVFEKAIRAKHPEIAVLSSAGPGVDDGHWRFAWDKFRAGVPAFAVDEHYYRPPAWFLANHARYDRYDRALPKVFAGEYAAHGPNKRGDLFNALHEAAFMTGLLRNADLVAMSCYAPLFARDGFQQWAPDLIWFDARRVQPTPSYHVQALFAQNRPDVVAPVTVTRAGAGAAAAVAGRIGVGTWNTQAEFRDIRVERDGKVLFQSDFSAGTGGWSTSGGQWDAADGLLRQRGGGENVRAMAGDPAWSDYTLTLKARKTGGAEGFLILFQTRAEERNWWNLGGWGNRGHGIEIEGVHSPAGPEVPGRIETGRWYTIRVETKGQAVRCFLDGKLVQELTRATSAALYAAAGLDRRARELVVHVANPGGTPVEARLDIAGLKPAGGGRAIVLTSASPQDGNTLDRPDKVAPRTEPLAVPGATLTRVFPAWSHTVLRIAEAP